MFKMLNSKEDWYLVGFGLIAQTLWISFLFDKLGKWN